MEQKIIDLITTQRDFHLQREISRRGLNDYMEAYWHETKAAALIDIIISIEKLSP